MGTANKQTAPSDFTVRWMQQFGASASPVLLLIFAKRRLTGRTIRTAAPVSGDTGPLKSTPRGPILWPTGIRGATAMTLIKRRQKTQSQQAAMSHPSRPRYHESYRKLSSILTAAGFDERCHTRRRIAWRRSDRVTVQGAPSRTPTDATPCRSSQSRIGKQLATDAAVEVFPPPSKEAVAKTLIDERLVAAVSTTLEADAAMKSIVQRGTGEDGREYFKRLMQEAGLIGECDKPTDDELRRFDQSRKDTIASNEEWDSESAPASRIDKTNNSTTHLAYKAENVVDRNNAFLDPFSSAAAAISNSPIKVQGAARSSTQGYRVSALWPLLSTPRKMRLLNSGGRTT